MFGKRFSPGNREKAGMAIGGILLLVGLLLTYRWIVFGDWPLLHGRYDVQRYFGPLAYYMDASLHDGVLPFWNPLTYCGAPFAANPQAMLWYPPNFLRGMLNFHPTPMGTQVGFVIMMGLHLLFAGLGARQLARAHGLSHGAAITSAFTFVFSALMIRRACEYHFVTTLAWLPWLLLAVKCTFDANDPRAKARYAIIGGIIFGMGILGGFFQIVNYMGVTSFAYACLYRALHFKKSWKALLADAIALLGLFGLGAILAAVLVLPAAELAGFGVRGGGSEVNLYSDIAKQPWLRLLQRLIVYPGMKYEPETIRGAGIAAFLFAMASLMHLRRRDVAMFLALLLILIDCTLGPPFPIATLVTLLTPFSISAHVRACDVALLPFALLAGFGVDAATADWRSIRWKTVRTAAVALAGAGLVAGLFQWTREPLYVPVSNGAIALPCAAVLTLAAGGWLPWRELLRWVLPLLLFAETLAWNTQYVPVLVPASRDHANHIEGTHPFPQENTRGTDPLANHRLYERASVINGYDPLSIAAVRSVISGPPRDKQYHRLVTDTETTTANTRGSLFLKRSFWLARQYQSGPLPPKDALYPVATTAFLPEGTNIPIPKANRLPSTSISTPGTPLELPLGRPSPGKRTYRLPISTEGRHAALFLEYTCLKPGNVETLFMDSRTRQTVHGFDARLVPTREESRTVEIPLPDYARMTASISATPGTEFTRAYILSDAEDEGAHVHVTHRSANRAEVDIESIDGERLLLFVDADYPGWHASVDGKPVPIIRANEAFKAVRVPAGTHHVAFTFSPARVYAGAALSAGTLAMALAALWMLRSRRQLPAATGTTEEDTGAGCQS